MWYDVDMELGEDEGGPVVWGSWTKAVAQKIVARSDGDGAAKHEVAAGSE